jgi:hypothetical protein
VERAEITMEEGSQWLWRALGKLQEKGIYKVAKAKDCPLVLQANMHYKRLNSNKQYETK